MASENQSTVLEAFQKAYEQGYRCIYYGVGEDDQLTVYLKNFDTEQVTTLKCDPQEGKDLIQYIQQLQ